MKKQNTALNQLLKWAYKNRNTEENQAGVIMTVVDYSELVTKATELLEAEKWQIINACNNRNASLSDGEKYYSETFENPK